MQSETADSVGEMNARSTIDTTGLTIRINLLSDLTLSISSRPDCDPDHTPTEG